MKEDDKIAREAKDVLSGRKNILATQNGNVLRIFFRSDDAGKLEKFCKGIKDYLKDGIEGYNSFKIIETLNDEIIGVIEVQSSDKINIMIDRWKNLCKYIMIDDEVIIA